MIKAALSNILPLVIRTFLASALLYGVFTETGIWTALFCGLMYGSFEVHNLLHAVMTINNHLLGPLRELKGDLEAISSHFAPPKA